MRTTFLVTCILLFSPMALHAEDSVAAARDLYTAANYEDALVVLNRLDSSSGQPSDRMAINQYRAFCLLALGRMAEAERAIEAVLIVDLLYYPVDAHMSPRLRAALQACGSGFCRRSYNRNTRARRRRSTVRITQRRSRSSIACCERLAAPTSGCGREPAPRRPSHAGQRVPRFEHQGGDPAAAPSRSPCCRRRLSPSCLLRESTAALKQASCRRSLFDRRCRLFLSISFRATMTASWKS